MANAVVESLNLYLYYACILFILLAVGNAAGARWLRATRLTPPLVCIGSSLHLTLPS